MRLRYMLVITAPILATSALLLLVGGTGAWYVQLINKDASLQLARNLECTLASEQVVLSLRDVRSQLQRFLDTLDEEDLRAALLLEDNITLDLQDAQRSATTDELQGLALRARENQQQFFADFKQEVQVGPRDGKKERIRALAESMASAVFVPAHDLLQEARQAATEHSERSRALADRIGLGLLVLGVCGAVAGLLAGFGIARGIALRIEASEREAARSEQLAAVGQLAAGLAHELRNPLTSMRVLVESGVDPAGAGLDRRDLEVIDEEINRLEKLVETFLEFARPPHLEKSNCDARKVVDQTLHLVGGPARQRGATIEWNRPDDPIPLEVDAVQMRQVLLNLLLNALDAVGDAGQIVIAVDRCGDRQDALATSWHEITISDNGPGVPDDMKEKIFLPFVSGRETGLGLGLAVSRRIVEAHGGELLVADNLGRGAIFTIRLPIAAQSVHVTEVTNQYASSGSNALRTPGRHEATS